MRTIWHGSGCAYMIFDTRTVSAAYWLVVFSTAFDIDRVHKEAKKKQQQLQTPQDTSVSEINSHHVTSSNRKRNVRNFIYLFTTRYFLFVWNMRPTRAIVSHQLHGTDDEKKSINICYCTTRATWPILCTYKTLHFHSVSVQSPETVQTMKRLLPINEKRSNIL